MPTLLITSLITLMILPLFYVLYQLYIMRKVNKELETSLGLTDLNAIKQVIRHQDFRATLIDAYFHKDTILMEESIDRIMQEAWKSNPFLSLDIRSKEAYFDKEGNLLVKIKTSHAGFIVAFDGKGVYLNNKYMFSTGLK